MKAITIKQFDSLDERDFENGAVRDSIRTALEEAQKQSALPTNKSSVKFPLIEELEKYLDRFYKESPDSDYDNNCGAYVFVDFIRKLHT